MLDAWELWGKDRSDSFSFSDLLELSMNLIQHISVSGHVIFHNLEKKIAQSCNAE